MEKNTISIADIPLGFCEKNPGRDHCIIFIHGNSGSAGNWLKQWNDPLLDAYHLLAFDLPGCGESQLPVAAVWDYSPLATGKLLAAAVKQLAGDKSYILTGFSYGSNVVGEMLGQGLTPAGIALLSACVIGGPIGLDKVFLPGDVIFFHDEKPEPEVQVFFSEQLLSGAEEDIRSLTADFFRARPPFRSALIQTAMQGKLSDEISELQKRDIPVLVAFGAEDRLLQTGYLQDVPLRLWEDRIHKIPGAGHYIPLDRADLVNPLMASYFEERFKAIHAP